MIAGAALVVVGSLGWNGFVGDPLAGAAGAKVTAISAGGEYVPLVRCFFSTKPLNAGEAIGPANLRPSRCGWVEWSHCCHYWVGQRLRTALHQNRQVLGERPR